MSAVRFKDLPRAIDGSSLSPGATLAFYAPATLTPRSTYADGARTVPSSNPITADAAARLQPFWLDPALEYRAILTDAAGVEIYDEDPVGVFPGTDTGIPLNDSGEPMPYARRTFWRSGTTALLPIYADASLTTELDNPLTADIAGEFPDIYLDNELAYRSLLHDGDGVLIYDIDPWQIIPDPPPDFLTALSNPGPNGSAFTAPSEWAFGTSSFSVEAWFKRTGVTDGEQNRVLRARSSGGSQSGWDFQIRAFGVPTTTQGIRLLLRPSSTDFTFDSPQFAILDDVYFHAAVTVDFGSNIATFYVNGLSIGTANVSSGAGNVGRSGSMQIMQSIVGHVDELRVWGDVRTAQEILDNYQLPYENLISTEGIIAAWQFNEGVGSTTTETVHATVATLNTGATFVEGPTP